MTETYFDFDSDTFQITQRKRLSESSGYSSSTPVLASPLVKRNNSEDTGFETSSEHSSLSQDGFLMESPRSISPRNTSGRCKDFDWPIYPRLDSLVSKPLKHYGSKESIKSSSSFWDQSNFSPETKSILSRIRDQMRSSLVRVKELEEQAKQLPLLQVKISILQEEKRQLAIQLQSKTNLRKSRSNSETTNSRRSSSSTDEFVFPRSDGQTNCSIGVGDHSVHDILCTKCKEFQDRLLGNVREPDHDQGFKITSLETSISSTASEQAKHQNDVIKVFQDRCTQTRITEHKDNFMQAVITLEDKSTSMEIENDSNSVRQHSARVVTLQDSSCDPIRIESKSVGVGQMRSFVKDACVGDNKEIATVVDVGVQNVVHLKDESCGEQQVATENIGINVSPVMISIGTGCSLFEKTSNNVSENKHCSVATQTVKNGSTCFSVGVGMFSIDDFDDCERCKLTNNNKHVSVEDILESNKFIFSGRTVGVGTCPWADLKRKVALDQFSSRTTVNVAVGTSISTRTVGCGDHSITDIHCQRCLSKCSRSLGVDCRPKVSEVAVGGDIPLSDQLAGITAKPDTLSVRVGGDVPLSDQLAAISAKPDTLSVGIGGDVPLSDQLAGISAKPDTLSVGIGGDVPLSDQLAGISAKPDTLSVGIGGDVPLSDQLAGISAKPDTLSVGIGGDVPLSAQLAAISAKPDTCTVGVGGDVPLSDQLTVITAKPDTLSVSVSVGGDVPLNDQLAAISGKPDTCTVGVGVGECCITDNYCERCFSLHTRTIGVGNGSILDDYVNQSDVSICNTPSGTLLRDEVEGALLQHCHAHNTTETMEGLQGFCSNDGDNQREKMDLTPVDRMFSEEYERITDDWMIFNYNTDDTIKCFTNRDEDILLTCQLLQKHFENKENLDENKLLGCMKNIEDYWFNCVTETKHGNEFISELLKLFKQNLPLLLDGLINSQDENGNTALHYLVTYGKFDCVNELLKTDLCDLNITNKAGYSAVMLASLKEILNEKNKIVLKHLFEKGNLNCIAQSTGQTALMLAAGTGRVDIVDLLIQCGAAQSINTTDLDGSTALMCACEHGYAAIVKRLLAIDGCDATIEDHDGSTCFSIAMEQNRKDIALMLYSQLKCQETINSKMRPTKR